MRVILPTNQLSEHAGAVHSREQVLSDLRAYFGWCKERGQQPLGMTRAQVELYVRWMQEVQHYAPSTVSRRLSVLVVFYRTCVIDGIGPPPSFGPVAL